MAFDAHGFVDEQAQAFGKAGVGLVSQELQDVVQEFRIGVVGHVWFLVLDVFVDTPTGNHGDPPSTSFLRAERLHPSGDRLRSARCARLRSASPRRGEGEWKKGNLQKDFYTDVFRLFLRATPSLAASFGRFLELDSLVRGLNVDEKNAYSGEKRKQ